MPYPYRIVSYMICVAELWMIMFRLNIHVAEAAALCLRH